MAATALSWSRGGWARGLLGASGVRAGARRQCARITGKAEGRGTTRCATAPRRASRRTTRGSRDALELELAHTCNSRTHICTHAHTHARTRWGTHCDTNTSRLSLGMVLAAWSLGAPRFSHPLSGCGPGSACRMRVTVRVCRSFVPAGEWTRPVSSAAVCKVTFTPLK